MFLWNFSIHSDSDEYSDWAENAPASTKPAPQPSTSAGTARRPASLRQIKPRHRLVSSDEDEEEGESEGDTNDLEDETSQSRPETSRRKRNQIVTPKKKVAVSSF